MQKVHCNSLYIHKSFNRLYALSFRIFLTLKKFFFTFPSRYLFTIDYKKYLGLRVDPHK